MRGSGRLLAVLVLMTGACSGAGENPRDQGRTYTEWLYRQDFPRLWARFSPEMKLTFQSPEALARFASRSVRNLGPEQGAPEEQVTREDSLTVYSRLARFSGSDAQVLLQWTLAPDGTVTGFLLRPSADSLSPG